MVDDASFQRASEVRAENTGKGRVIIAWTFVLVPLFWGVTQTLVKSVALFR